MDVAAAKVIYEARFKGVYARRDALAPGFRGNHEKLAALQAWVDCAEEMACVAYDVVRFQAQAAGTTREDLKVGLEAEAGRMAARHAELSIKLPELEAAIG